MNKLVIGALLDKINEYFIDTWLEHYKKYNPEKIVFMIESCGAEAYQKLIDAGVECHFVGGPWYEGQVRTRLLKECQKYNPDWFFFTVADEIFEDKMLTEIHNLMNDPKYNWYAFRLIHFWESELDYRVDGIWGVSTFNMDICRLFRNNVLPEYDFGTNTMHGSAVPTGMRHTPGTRTDIRIKHYGAARPGSYNAKCLTRGKTYDVAREHANVRTFKWDEAETWAEQLAKWDAIKSDFGY
ncbi:MAG: hypothetical protein HQ538_06430 [Parcubacteria group bacterium]|nr:hypothetical protein [Parcubacteria group bacterium]